MKPNCISFEMSLKPFKKTDESYIREVCRKVFTQWKPLCFDIPTVSILLWTADGSEILDYKGKLDEEFDWGMYAGGCNACMQSWNPDRDPKREGLHTRTYLYTDNPPVMSYRLLKKIIGIIKEEGKAILGQKTVIRVGETFDPGPEFANSDFKYKRHREVCTASTFLTSFISSYATLHADDYPYAGYPNGIPEGLALGSFLGRQSNIFLRDMGFDYLWLSNGFGFGRDTWSTTGAVFDGEHFHHEQSAEVRKVVVDFWRLFREECPDFPVETRGTNMSVGIDYAKDGVPLYAIYHNGYNILPPPNSPWAALDGDFGLELMGYLSRIADLPDDKQFLFRYYLHDPWWVNSPWYDRYQGQPHDIYLPLSCGRIDKKGKISLPTHFNILSIDNTFGNMPDNCVNECLPHLARGFKEAPDAVAPVVWVYPFREYCTAEDESQLNAMFGGDWFVRGAINNGFPLSMVISNDNFLAVDRTIFKSSVLFAPIPLAGSKIEKALLSYVNEGGKAIFYGPLDHASEAFRTLVGVSVCEKGVSGELPVTVDGKGCGVFRHAALLCAGEINTVAEQGTTVLASTGRFALCTCRGTAAWVRGSVSSDFVKGNRLLVPHDSRKYFPSETLALRALSCFGVDIRYENQSGERSPIVILSRYDNAMMLSAYLPSTTAKVSIRTPLGAPVLLGYETVLENGYATYHFPKSEHRECRFFVEMQDGVVSAKELPPVSFRLRRRIEISGLKDATVRVFGELECCDKLELVSNGIVDEYTHSDPIDGEFITDEYGTYFEAHHVNGKLTVSMPRLDFKPQPISERDKEVNIVVGTPNYL